MRSPRLTKLPPSQTWNLVAPPTALLMFFVRIMKVKMEKW
jgi:hypothetical protein